MTITNIRPGERIKVHSRGVTESQLSAVETSVDAVVAEVVAARDGLTNLDTRLDTMRDAGLATQAEITAARDGLLNLDTRLDAIRDAGEATQAEVTALQSSTASVQTLMRLNFGRPGDAPELFIDNLDDGVPYTGSSATYAVVNNTTCGSCMRIPGSGILAHGTLFALEPSRIWLIRFAGVRSIDSEDPELDGVDRGVAYYSYNKTALVGGDATDLMTSIAPTVLGGRFMDRVTVSRGGGADMIAPSGARYFRPFVQTHGSSPSTDIEVIWPVDMTEIVEGGWSEP